MKLRLLMAMMALFITVQSQAGLLIDPYIGIGQVKNTSDLAAVDGDSASITGIGSRLGYSFLLFSAGIDYEMVKTESDGDDVSITNMSAFVGVDFPILVRAWAEYFVSSKFDSDSNVDFSFKDGYGVGVGFTGLPLVSINLELDFLNYDIDAVGTDIPFSTASTLLSVSFPIDL